METGRRLASLWARVASFDPRISVINHHGIRVSDGITYLPFLGEILHVDPRQRELKRQDFTRSPTFQEGLVTLPFPGHYKPIGLSKRWIALTELSRAESSLTSTSTFQELFLPLLSQ